MDWSRAVRNLGRRLIIAATAVLVVVLGLTVERYPRNPDRELCQEIVIHHFERSSWFAMNAEKHESIDPELTRRFKEVAAWHARRAREFERMNQNDFSELRAITGSVGNPRTTRPSIPIGVTRFTRNAVPSAIIGILLAPSPIFPPVGMSELAPAHDGEG